jgi:hypothetical protein
MFDTRAQAIYSVCQHEARHAVSAWALHMPVVRVGRIGRSGYCEYHEPVVMDEFWSLGRPVRPTTLRRLAPAVAACMVALLAGISGEAFGAQDPGCAQDLQDTAQLWARWRSVNAVWIPPLADVRDEFCTQARLLLLDFPAQYQLLTEAVRRFRRLEARDVAQLLGPHPPRRR